MRRAGDGRVRESGLGLSAALAEHSASDKNESRTYMCHHGATGMIDTNLSVIIPALNAGDGLAATLAALRCNNAEIEFETIVVDGGSSDDTAAIARSNDATVIRSERGRGRQLKAGADLAKGDWLLFLHADTCLASTWLHEVTGFARQASNAERIAAFRLGLDDRSPAARRLERMVGWRCRWLRLPYGDQGLLVKRSMYFDVGGYRAIPFLEDVDLLRRLGRDRVVMFDTVATTSSERHRRSGYLRQGLRNILLVVLFYVGVSPERLARFYR